MTSEFAGRVAIVTGAGAGLGRCHALALARAGARVVVNDMTAADGAAGEAARSVVREIMAFGGEAVAEPADVSSFAAVEAMVERVIARWGRVDILVNNAGILRDRSFARMEMADFDRVVAVHLSGSANCCRAVWEAMHRQGYGRIVLTTSCSGLYGNFGQANYAAAKTGMIGLMTTLQQEGSKHGIRVNCLSPLATTGMTEGLFTAEDAIRLTPEAVSPAVVFMASEVAPEKTIIGAGAGVYSVVHVVETEGVYLPPEARSPADFRAVFAQMSDISTARTFNTGFDQAAGFIATANRARALAG
ncbi:MAG: SDR family NAD(P)-dependent oxidoreductase [Alphaproteobacteria bacterium]|nr:SDR family NAD(P)-dependent oxidoreductase [Alphaproteobacteria bacterium]MBU1547962.1 SDR family NAD(P)-dependent oxidoreductase [Alphaproteobacteria bacterium]MBU2336276.1 SDR family NAD(P)-dependent oxidoreductase [Alphaproteobacteria bacterium]MBU2390329.1 SDR family NAD(P)-dependent oxidoreductase [Alphaproteobacteria bacterium]